MATSSLEQEAHELVFIGPGLSTFKRIVTYGGIVAVIALIILIGWSQNAPIGVSSIVAIIFTLGFVWYLSIVAPVPFTITIGQDQIIRKSRKGEVIAVDWDNLARIKEEFFPNKKRISITLYRKVLLEGEKSKVWSVYRDDIINIDAFADALESAPIPPSCKWDRLTVHE